MEQRFGHDFSRVRVHVGSAAEQSAREVSARAYTVGSDVVFGAGAFAPRTREGQRLIAHELTHVVQQDRGAPAGRVRRDASDKPCGPVGFGSAWSQWATIEGGPYANQGIVIPYDKLAPLSDPMADFDRAESVRTFKDPSRLEQVYHDATQPIWKFPDRWRAAWWLCSVVEPVAREIGAKTARDLNSIGCLTIQNCGVNWGTVLGNFSDRTASGLRNRALLLKGFTDISFEIGLSLQIINSALMLYGGVAAARTGLAPRAPTPPAPPAARQAVSVGGDELAIARAKKQAKVVSPSEPAPTGVREPVVAKPKAQNDSASDDIAKARAKKQAKAMPRQQATVAESAVAAGAGGANARPGLSPQYGYVKPTPETAGAGAASAPRGSAPQLGTATVAPNAKPSVNAKVPDPSPMSGAAASPQNKPEATPRPRPIPASNAKATDKEKKTQACKRTPGACPDWKPRLTSKHPYWDLVYQHRFSEGLLGREAFNANYAVLVLEGSPPIIAASADAFHSEQQVLWNLQSRLATLPGCPIRGLFSERKPCTTICQSQVIPALCRINQAVPFDVYYATDYYKGDSTAHDTKANSSRVMESYVRAGYMGRQK
jgi:hypothetical protein